jgi:phosphohistidine swiveling domain-containing protein
MARRNAYLRETPKFHYLRRLEQLRRLYLEVARRSMSRGGLEQRKDVFWLQCVEVAAALDPRANREIGRVASARRRRRDQLVERHIPPFFRWDRLEEVLSSAHLGAEDGSASESGLLRGDGVSPGRVTGRARIVTDPGDSRALGPDAILIAPRADPGWTPLFLAVRAVVVETGSLISHSSIVAREYGLPMVVNVPHATRLREGVALTVDGTEGWLRVEESDDDGQNDAGASEPDTHPGR